MTKKFAIIGASGYIAPRHVRAIKEVGGDLVAMLDPSDSVGYIDQYFPSASFFKETERFDRHIDRMRRKGSCIDYVAICSPNYLHDAHIRLSLRNGCNVICEKPLVLKSEHLKSLSLIEKESNKKINTILQLREHPSVKVLKEKYNNTKKIHIIDLKYITPRGVWYDFSWKGEIDSAGGILMNIGIHFFDMLIWIFGDVISFDAINESRKSTGSVLLKNAHITYELSTDHNDLPWTEWKPYRHISIDGENLEFSDGFSDLHTESYRKILTGEGCGISDVKPSISLAEGISKL